MLRAAEITQRTDTGLQRRGNEDSSFARAPVFVVADGMGGAQAGEVASRIAVQAFEQGLPEVGSAEERLATLVHEANARIYERSHAEAKLDGMGTTVTAALLEDEHVAIAHVGDSRAYLFRDGELTRLTRDHSLVDELVRQGKLTEEQAADHPQRSIITRALGPEATVEVDTWSVPARPGDVLLLCSDGLTSMISDARILEILSGTSALDEAADQMIAGANAAGGRDNITVVLFRVEDVGGSPVLEQPTVIAPPTEPAPDRRPPPGEATIEPSGATIEPSGATIASTIPEPGPPPVVPPPDLTRAGAIAQRIRHPRLARTQGRPEPPAPKRRSERFIKSVSALIATLIVVFLLGGGGYIATRQLYFVGTNSSGIVAVYRGLPYQLPFGLKLYETYYTSGVPASIVPADRRAALFNHDLRSQSDATKLVMNLELGNITK